MNLARRVTGRLRSALDPRPEVATDAWDRRVATLVGVLGEDAGTGSAPGSDPEARLLRLLADASEAQVWLALAVLSARLPAPAEVVTVRRAARTAGPSAVLEAARAATTGASARREVRVLRDRTLVDMGDLVLFPLGTGIQRVARNVGRVWRDRHDVTAVAWTPELDALRALTAAERDRALAGDDAPVLVDVAEPGDAAPVVVVPWGGRYLLPELAIQVRRCAALHGLAAHSPTRCGVIGFDLVPITSAETSAEGFAAVFALNLAAVAEFDAVAAISDAAATEYEGWRRMLGGAGLPGPHVEAVGLPAHAPEPSEADLAEARDRFTVGGQPLVLCVGSHEPRKNHLAVLHAAELLWRRGRRFTLTFVGGNSWNSDAFSRRLGELQGAGRPVESVSRLDDRLLWAAYRVAHCTVFPSLNEGFGLPVAESVAAGTPALASDFGSMREIAARGGVLLVDPRDDHAIADGLDRLLTDDALHARLTADAAVAPETSWEEYAERVWDLLTGAPAAVVAGSTGERE
ncbi:glycosyltransferase family 4 protein [Cellulomonas hominis]|uniref:Glycosyltransferase family 4 protein n=1 Tax=Cellulomonas hominis TaxID=156981 RepID=A0A7Z8JY98_9CELL|nr:glycosyltransferase family 1 protein [Cellulomonas hominis]TKR23332.1 glycosyltransferase family 4 protein [Cellulomonas hominis]